MDENTAEANEVVAENAAEENMVEEVVMEKSVPPLLTRAATPRRRTAQTFDYVVEIAGVIFAFNEWPDEVTDQLKGESRRGGNSLSARLVSI